MLKRFSPNTFLSDKDGWKLTWHKLYEHLGIKGSHLPRMGLSPRRIGDVTVWVISEEEARIGSSLSGQHFIHRVLCECPRCGEVVSAGRLHQHARSERCTRTASAS